MTDAVPAAVLLATTVCLAGSTVTAWVPPSAEITVGVAGEGSAYGKTRISAAGATISDAFRLRFRTPNGTCPASRGLVPARSSRPINGS